MSSGQISTSTSVTGSSLTQFLPTLLAALAVCSSGSGCGQSTYAERVNRTAEVFAYQNRLDQTLQSEWGRGDWQMSLRPPLKFRLMPAPPPPKANEEGILETVPDSRQPPYLGVEFPGLVAAWEIPGEAFLYLCSNHQRFIDGQSGVGELADPEAFLLDLETMLQQAFEFTLSTDPARGPTELHAKFSERIPLSDQFAPPKQFQSIRIQNAPDAKLAASVYEHQSGKIQMALILVYSPSNPGSFDTSVRVALETLRVEPVIPRGAPAPGATGGATPGNVPSAF